jgi:hypothetical protein
LGREVEVEAAGLEVDLDAMGLKDTFDRGGQDSVEEDNERRGTRRGRRGMRRVQGCTTRGWG